MLSHFDNSGAARMVDVGQKAVTERTARASARVRMLPATLAVVQAGSASKKGDVLQVARLAGIMAAKRTGDLIPLCHPLPLDGVTIDFGFPNDAAAVGTGAESGPVMSRSPDRDMETGPEAGRPAVAASAGSGDPRTTDRDARTTEQLAALTIEATVRTTARTGVEMEALTAVAVAALTVYDMCKSVDRGMVIEQIQLEEKSGGKSGHFKRAT